MTRGLRKKGRGARESGGNIRNLAWREDLSGKETSLWTFGRTRRDGNPTNTELGHYRIYRGVLLMMLEELCAIGLASSLTEQEC